MRDPLASRTPGVARRTRCREGGGSANAVQEGKREPLPIPERANVHKVSSKEVLCERREMGLMVGQRDLYDLAERNPKLNRTGLFEFVSGWGKKSVEKKAKGYGLTILKGGFIGRGKEYRLIGWKKE